MENKITILWFIIGFPLFIISNLYSDYDSKNEEEYLNKYAVN